ncbi:hypothetical protein ZRA01_38630 [Zoogloea ramigera]|uniref:Uncharacterized protein n=1 Tax=Zoogloea ramigera TaxID=350 RepID=A0A4Y4D4U9_ZOORA|nr:hypothetical protein [Zoogloea ramigera]GEC97790.1 hypothetical protein ZRA01_38630 [Zoogloea ramigera]
MSLLSFLPALVLALNEPTFVLIAMAQAALVFFLCLASKNRLASIFIGIVGVVVALMVGDSRYGWLDVLFVIAATAAAIWKLTPHEEGETRGEVLAFAGQAAGVVVLLIACGAAGLWYYANHGAAIETTASDETARSLSRPVAELKPRPAQLQEPIIEAPEPVATPQRQPVQQGGLVPDWKFSEIKYGMSEAEIIAIIGPPGSVVEVRSSDGRKTSALWGYRSESGGSHSFMMHNGRYR